MEKLKDIEKHNDKILKAFFAEFKKTKKPIEVSFRKLIPDLKAPERFTHQIHKYPAKLLVHIPYFFINNSILSKKKEFILDPFNGSGTVMLESILSGRNAYGADANPLARLIAEVKVTKLNIATIYKCLGKILSYARSLEVISQPEVTNCEYWFPKRTIEELSRLKQSIDIIDDEGLKKFMLLSFSSCVHKVSLADSRISVPVRLNPNRFDEGSVQYIKVHEKIKSLENIDVFEKFQQIVKENIKRVETLNNELAENDYVAKIISNDARELTTNLNSTELLSNESIQLIITSPPYAGAQKYIRASSLNLNWTGLASKFEIPMLDNLNIGRENIRKIDRVIESTGIIEADELIKTIFNINPTRAYIIYTYLQEMKLALQEMMRVLKKGGYIVLVVGNNKVCNLEFNTQEYLTSYLLSIGLELKVKLIDDIKSYGLMTKRNKTADIISREWVLVFKKS